MRPKLPFEFTALNALAVAAAIFIAAQPGIAKAAATVACTNYALVLSSCGSPVAGVPWFWCGYANTSGVSTPYAWNGVTLGAIQVAVTSYVEPGASCPAGAIGVHMSNGDYQAMVGASAVNETLSIGLVVLFLFMGLGLGYYVFGPRRRSIVDAS